MNEPTTIDIETMRLAEELANKLDGLIDPCEKVRIKKEFYESLKEDMANFKRLNEESYLEKEVPGYREKIKSQRERKDHDITPA